MIIKINLQKIMEYLVRFLKINFSCRKFIGNIPKLLMMFIIYCIVFLALLPDYSPGFWKKLLTRKLSPDRILVLGVSSRIGEYNLYQRILKGFDNIGMDYYGVAFADGAVDSVIIRGLFLLPLNILNYFLEPMINFTTTHYINIIPNGYNLVYLNVPRSMLYNTNNGFSSSVKHLYQYDGYVDLYSYVHQENDILLDLIKKNDKKKQIFPLFFGDNMTTFKEAKLETALITGSVWGCGRDNLRVKRVLKLLAKEKLLVAVGLPVYRMLGDAYLGTLSALGGKNMSYDYSEILRMVQQKYGISIVFHTLEHMIEGIPTLRIAEAAASGNLIISDDSLFVKRYFGNNVLYVNTIASEHEIYQQLRGHILWARANPELANEKARKSYDIFINNLTIEKSLLEMLDRVKANKDRFYLEK
jgi:hypothetical protein